MPPLRPKVRGAIEAKNAMGAKQVGRHRWLPLAWLMLAGWWSQPGNTALLLTLGLAAGLYAAHLRQALRNRAYPPALVWLLAPLPCALAALGLSPWLHFDALLLLAAALPLSFLRPLPDAVQSVRLFLAMALAMALYILWQIWASDATSPGLPWVLAALAVSLLAGGGGKDAGKGGQDGGPPPQPLPRARIPKRSVRPRA